MIVIGLSGKGQRIMSNSKLSDPSAREFQLQMAAAVIVRYMEASDEEKERLEELYKRAVARINRG